jgi:bacterial/archaeal transporter family-2 protein
MKMDTQTMLFVCVGILGGVCVAVEGSLNSLLGHHVGVLKAVIAPFAVGLLTILVAVVVVTGFSDSGPGGGWFSAPWYSYLGGVAAAVFVGSVIYVAPKMGVAAAFSAILVGQFVASLILDATGWFAAAKIPITGLRLTGLLFVIVGMNLFFTKSGT